ncbi:MAG TPA: TetR family transcriptional regulator [Longimicrobiales bacterium]|nr:TetR family transcriptional regulator [Longimicrobiales bacterium]
MKQAPITPDRAPRRADTADALLRAGRALFAHHGYDGASVRAITDSAGANLGAITYHFGSKRNLYGAVLRECIAPLAERIRAAVASPAPPLERVEAVVRAYFRYMLDTPELPRLLMQELVMGREPADEVAAAIRPVLGALRGVVLEGQADGTIREGDPALMAMSIVSQPLHMILGQRLLAKVAGVELRDPETRERLMAHAARFARNGLASGREGQ